MNRDLLSKIMIFVAGVGIGSVVTYKLVKKHYDQIIQEEIDSVKEVFSKKEETIDVTELHPKVKVELAEQEEENPEMDKYKKLVRDYRKESTKKKEEKEEDEEMDIDKPYVISPEEFDTLDDWETISLTYYQDGVVTDDAGEPMSDEEIESAIGFESLEHFGEYEEDSVFVRNDERRTDYEILMDADYYNPQD